MNGCAYLAPLRLLRSHAISDTVSSKKLALLHSEKSIYVLCAFMKDFQYCINMVGYCKKN